MPWQCVCEYLLPAIGLYCGLMALAANLGRLRRATAPGYPGLSSIASTSCSKCRPCRRRRWRCAASDARALRAGRRGAAVRARRVVSHGPGRVMAARALPARPAAHAQRAPRARRHRASLRSRCGRRSAAGTRDAAAGADRARLPPGAEGGAHGRRSCRCGRHRVTPRHGGAGLPAGTACRRRRGNCVQPRDSARSPYASRIARDACVAPGSCPPRRAARALTTCVPRTSRPPRRRASASFAAAATDRWCRRRTRRAGCRPC